MQRIFKIAVNGTPYDVTVEELTDGATQLMPKYNAAAPAQSVSQAPVATPAAFAPPTAAAGAGDQCAQMGGVIVQIYAKEGQSVNEGDRIMELEAMKMKVPVIADRTGPVSRLLVAVGDAVVSGQPLATIG